MRYLGSKRKLFKHIAPYILRKRVQGQSYVEPFVGGCNSIDKVAGHRIGGDTNSYLIKMWKALQKGWIPPNNISRDFYYDVRDNKDKYTPEIVAFVGFCCSFGGKWFNGYAFDSKGINYALQGKNSLFKQLPFIKGIHFYNCSYEDLFIPKKSIIYCDPPYGNTLYGSFFIQEHFYNWCRKMKQKGHEVFISGYDAPDDFNLLFERMQKTILNKNKKQIRVEKLFKC